MVTSRSICLVFLGIALSFYLAGQSYTYYPKPKHPEWFKAIPQIDEDTPHWAVALYEEDDNFVKIEGLIKEYYKTHAWEKNIHTQNYKFWLKNVRNYIGDDGRINKPSASL